MILRRLSQSLKDQNWIAICVEFVLLVCGVFLGIEAQQWSSERAERRLEHVYLKRVQSDIDASIETNELNVARLTAYSDEESFIVDSLRRCSLPEARRDFFADGLSDLGKVGPSVFVLSTVDEMLSAGKFSIIRNPEIRDALNGLARDARYQNNIFNAIYAQIGAATTTTSTRVIRTYTDHKTPFDPVRWDELDIDFPALCEDREFQAAVSTIRYLTDAGISLNQRALNSLRSARAKTERELSRMPDSGVAAP